MRIGVPTEIKSDEYRVAMLPIGAEELTERGHEVVVQSGAGEGSGITDEDFQKAGATILETAAEVFAAADMIVKVKEPQPSEYGWIRPEQLVFTFFHFAASQTLTEAMLASGSSCYAYETLRDTQDRLPLLTPMSEVAGRMSVQQGAKCLEKPQMGRGILLGGVPGVAPAHVTILGGGVVGTHAAKIAAGFQADVSILDVNLDRLRFLDDVLPANVNVLFSDRHTILDEIQRADLVVGAVLVPGRKTPQLVHTEDLKLMKAGSVIVDVAVDQGGCIATSRPTTHQQPTFIIDDVVHYCVTNIPGAVSRTSTYALCNATLPYVIRLASQGNTSEPNDRELASALNIHHGEIVNQGVADAFGS